MQSRVLLAASNEISSTVADALVQLGATKKTGRAPRSRLERVIQGILDEAADGA